MAATFEFLNYRFEGQPRRVLYRRSKRIHLGYPESRLLELLLERAIEGLVTVEELERGIWPDEENVGENRLYQAVSRLRSKLGKDGKIIQGTKGRGYSVDVEVRSVLVSVPTNIGTAKEASTSLPTGLQRDAYHPVGLEFVVRRRREAGRGPCSERPSAHD
jgi:DNA-binding winged helix-turn-helix (wHTH) protein